MENTANLNQKAEATPLVYDIGSLWQRFVAFIADSLIIGVPCMILALPFFDWLSQIGPWGQMIGFLIALPYFAILDSSLGGGQTLGKRWRHLRVVDKEGHTISFWKSLARYSIFSVPYYLNGIALPVTKTPLIILTSVSLLIAGVGGITLYLLLFNKHTSQGLHDLAVGSYVARAERTEPLKFQPIWKGHWIFVGLFLVLLPIGSIMGYKASQSSFLSPLLEDVRLIEKMDNVLAGGAQDMIFHSSGSTGGKHILMLSVKLYKSPADEEKFAGHVANLILDHDPNAKNHDAINVALMRGYDLGIASWKTTRVFSHSPYEWSALYKESSSPDAAEPVK